MEHATTLDFMRDAMSGVEFLRASKLLVRLAYSDIVKEAL